MNYYAFSALVVCLTAVASGAFVFWKNPRGQKNLYFQLVVLTAGLWSFFYMLWQMSANATDALFFIRIAIAFAVMIPVTNFHVFLKILDAETPRRLLFLQLFYGVSFFVVLFTFTPYLIARVEPRGGFPYWPVPGPVIPIHFINLFIPSLWILYLIYEKGKKSTPLVRNKLKWLVVSVLVGYAAGMSNNFLWYNIPIRPKLSILSSSALIGVALTFFRPAIIDFNYFVRKTFQSTVYFLLTAASVFWMLIPFHERLSVHVLILLATTLGLALYPLMKKLTLILAEKFTLGRGPSSHLIKASREKIRESTYTYTDLARNIVDLILATLPVEMAAVYFFDINKREFYLCAQKGMKNPLAANLRYNRTGLSVPATDPLLRHLEFSRTLINVEALLNDLEEVSIRPLVDSMQRLEGEICSPFIFGEKLRGFLAVGRRKDNSLFNEEEIDVILSYSQMGTDVMHTIMAMETELNHTALYSHDINHDIRSIAQTLEFLRSPMARTQGEEKIQQLLSRAENVATKLYESFQMNRDRSALIMKTIRGDYEKKEVHPSEIVLTSTSKFSLQAEKAKAAFIVDVQRSDIAIQGNELDLTRVIDNLISNALRHLPAQGGQVAVVGRASGAHYEVVIKDNGEGIPPEDLEKIWELGWQAKNGKKGSAGFGLAIVKEIVRIHDGTIEAFSPGKGSGAEFKITF